MQHIIGVFKSEVSSLTQYLAAAELSTSCVHHLIYMSNSLLHKGHTESINVSD